MQTCFESSHSIVSSSCQNFLTVKDKQSSLTSPAYRYAMNPFLSKKFRFYSFLSMALLVFVHGYNLNDRYLQPWTIVNEPITFNTFTQYLFANGIFRFRIPMLFGISGYLFALHDGKAHGERIKKRARTLLLPYFLWSMIGLLTAVLLTIPEETREVVYNTGLQPTGKPFNEYNVGDWIISVIFPTSFQLWFLRCLFMYNLLYPLLKKGVLKIPWVIFILFGLMWLGTFGLFLIEGEGLFFFSLGIWLCKREKDIENRPGWLNLPLWTIIFLAASIIKTWLAFKGWQFIGGVLFLIMSLLHKLVIFSGLVVVWYGCDWLVKLFMDKKWFNQLCSFSFIIYALHVPLVTYLIDPTFWLLKDVPNYRFLAFIFLPLTMIAFCIMVGWALRKTAPKVYSVLTGGRGLS